MNVAYDIGGRRLWMRLHYIGVVGHARIGTRVTLFVKDLNLRVISEDGHLFRHMRLDPTRDESTEIVTRGYDAPTHHRWGVVCA